MKTFTIGLVKFLKGLSWYVSAGYFMVYFALFIFIPFLEVQVGQVTSPTNSQLALIFKHPLIFFVMMVVLFEGTFRVGKQCAHDEVVIAERKMLARINARQDDLVNLINLARTILKLDKSAEDLVKKFLEKIKKEQSMDGKEDTQDGSETKTSVSTKNS